MYCSGMSGGVVFTDIIVKGDGSTAGPCPIGIVFEGSPGSSEEWASRAEGLFLTERDVLIKAHTLTPQIFEGWLAQAGFY